MVWLLTLEWCDEYLTWSVSDDQNIDHMLKGKSRAPQSANYFYWINSSTVSGTIQGTGGTQKWRHKMSVFLTGQNKYAVSAHHHHHHTERNAKKGHKKFNSLYIMTIGTRRLHLHSETIQEAARSQTNFEVRTSSDQVFLFHHFKPARLPMS